MKIIAYLLGDSGLDKDEIAIKDQTEREIEAERGRLRASVQSIQSGSRVLENMSSMLHLINLNSRIER